MAVGIVRVVDLLRVTGYLQGVGERSYVGLHCWLVWAEGVAWGELWQDVVWLLGLRGLALGYPWAGEETRKAECPGGWCWPRWVRGAITWRDVDWLPVLLGSGKTRDVFHGAKDGRASKILMSSGKKDVDCSGVWRYVVLSSCRTCLL